MDLETVVVKFNFLQKIFEDVHVDVFGYRFCVIEVNYINNSITIR